MRIAMVSKFYPKFYGGTERHVFELSSRLIKKNHDVHVITSERMEQKHFEYKNIPVHNIFPMMERIYSYPSFSGLYGYVLFKHFIRQLQPDIIHLHFPSFNLEFLLPFLKRRFGYKFILTPHTLLDFHLSPASFWFGRSVDKYIAVSKAVMDRLVEKGVDVKKISLIPNGVDTRFFSPGKSDFKDKIKAEKILTFIARLVPEKGVNFLLKIFDEVSRHNSDIKLVIVGSGPLYKKLSKIKNKNILLTGYVNHLVLKEILRSSDIFLFPSQFRGEAQAVVLLEAMSCGVPVITTSMQGIKSWFPKSAGFILNSNSLEDFVDKTLYLLDNKKKAKAMGRNGRKIVKKLYDWNKVVNRIENVYKDSLNDK